MPHLTRDGVKLYYDEAGSGSPIVFVPGWTCNRSHFAPQAAHFSSAHRCISVDLRGHGESDTPEQVYTIEAFADDVAWMCGELGVTRGVLVGHSMGGAIALALAARRPELCEALVMLDPAILFPADLQPLIARLIAGFRSPDGARILREWAAGRFFLDTSDPPLKERILDAMCGTPMHVVASAFERTTAFDAETALRAVRVPVLYVEADPVIGGRVDRLREMCPDVMTAKTVGSGHFHQLEVPDQINAMLERFLAISGVA